MAEAEYRLRLFVAGKEPNSCLAERHLRTLCGEHLAGRHAIEVIDVLADFSAALEAGIMVAPALVLVAPRRATLYGTLADTARVLAALGIAGSDDGP